MTVVKVRKSTRLRAGKSSPSCVSAGMEKAIASETTPRIPAQPTIRGDVHGIGPSRSLMRAENHCGR